MFAGISYWSHHGEFAPSGCRIPVFLKDAPWSPLWFRPDGKNVRPPSDYPSQRGLVFLWIKLSSGTSFPRRVETKLRRRLWTILHESLSNLITGCLIIKVRHHLGFSALVDGYPPQVAGIFNSYQDELRYICSPRTLLNDEDISESEVVIRMRGKKVAEEPYLSPAWTS